MPVPITRKLRLTANPASCARRSEEHTSELQSHLNLVCRLLLEKKKQPSEVEPHWHRLRPYLLDTAKTATTPPQIQIARATVVWPERSCDNTQRDRGFSARPRA